MHLKLEHQALLFPSAADTVALFGQNSRVRVLGCFVNHAHHQVFNSHPKWSPSESGLRLSHSLTTSEPGLSRLDLRHALCHSELLIVLNLYDLDGVALLAVVGYIAKFQELGVLCVASLTPVPVI